jgi:hypothetical protein
MRRRLLRTWSKTDDAILREMVSRAASISAMSAKLKRSQSAIGTRLNDLGISRGKAKPKYQSKRDGKLKWSGRGMLPIWMREEMKGTELTKDSFLIK